jgi:hypothetical protein
MVIILDKIIYEFRKMRMRTRTMESGREGRKPGLVITVGVSSLAAKACTSPNSIYIGPEILYPRVLI